MKKIVQLFLLLCFVSTGMNAMDWYAMVGGEITKTSNLGYARPHVAVTGDFNLTYADRVRFDLHGAIKSLEKNDDVLKSGTSFSGSAEGSVRLFQRTWLGGGIIGSHTDFSSNILHVRASHWLITMRQEIPWNNMELAMFVRSPDQNRYYHVRGVGANARGTMGKNSPWIWTAGVEGVRYDWPYVEKGYEDGYSLTAGLSYKFGN